MKRQLAWGILGFIGVTGFALPIADVAMKYWDNGYQEWGDEHLITVEDGNITWITPRIIDSGKEWAELPADQYTIFKEVSYEQLHQDDVGDDGRIR